MENDQKIDIDYHLFLEELKNSSDHPENKEEKNSKQQFDESKKAVKHYKPRFREVQRYNVQNGSYTCWDCGKSYKANSSLSRHRSLDCGPKEKKIYNCKLCNYKSKYKGNYDRHLKTSKHYTEPEKSSKKTIENYEISSEENEEQIEEENVKKLTNLSNDFDVL